MSNALIVVSLISTDQTLKDHQVSVDELKIKGLIKAMHSTTEDTVDHPNCCQNTHPPENPITFIDSHFR